MRPLNLIISIFVGILLLLLIGFARHLAEHGGKKRWKAQVCTWVAILFVVGLAGLFDDLLSDIGPASWVDVIDWIVPAGYSSHSVETIISAQQDWFVGETKECYSLPLDFRIAEQFGKEPGYVAASITCDKGPEHTVKVNLFGRLNQPEHQTAYWRCTRESEGFTCRQTAAD